jgi:hypothetical protein
MAYFGELDTGLRIYLDNRHHETTIATFSAGAAQMELFHQDLHLGRWNAPPEIWQTPTGVVVKVETSQGQHYISLAGKQVGLLTEVPTVSDARKIRIGEVSCIPPLQPMTA